MFRTFMDDALEEAAKALKRGEVPVGAVIVEASGDIIARAGNETRERLDPSAHAEVLAIRKACDTLKTDRLVNCDIYVTLEPCLMCFGACIHARIDRLIFATEDPKSGVVINNLNLKEEEFFNHKISVSSGILAQESSELLKKFFQERRN